MLRDALAAFQPGEIGFIADPYPAYDELGRAGRIHYDERTDHWLITRHAEVNALLRDRRFGRTYLTRPRTRRWATRQIGRSRRPSGGLKSLPVRA